MKKKLTDCCRGEKGQALVEMALVLPLLLLLMAGIIQFGIVFSGWINVTAAAREGARLAAVGADNTTITAGVEAALQGHNLLTLENTTINPAGERFFGEPVAVEVTCSTGVFIPFFEQFAGSDRITLNSRSVMRVETGGGGF